MTPETADTSPTDLIDALRTALGGREDVELALLFGSRARGREREDPADAFGVSDVDLAVEAEGLDSLALAAELSRAAGLEVQVVDLRRAGYALLKALLRDAVVVHEGRPHAEARFRTRALLQVENDRPYFERMRDAYLERLAEGGHG